MATPSMPAVVLRRQITSGQQTVEEKVAPATYAEYIAIKKHKGTAIETLDRHLSTLHTQADTATQDINELKSNVSSLQTRLGTINKMSYGTSAPSGSGVVGEVYFKINR